jgi:hypothetical protein
MADEFQVVEATRQAVPMLISLSGTSGSGKTLSGILLASGIASGGTVGLIDAENGRGTLYADSPMVKSALPKGYKYLQINAPYTPARYIKAIQAMEAAGVTVCLIDSTSHEWEGEGGCTDIAEKNKRGGMANWASAKLEHKRFLAYCLSSQMHIIFCLRARDKVKITPDKQVIPIGIQPVCEKNFVFEMLLSLQFDEQTHHYSGIKVPEMLSGIFRGGELITKDHGAAIRKWADGGMAVDPNELLKKRARSAAELGMAGYSEFFQALPPTQKKCLAADPAHEDNKRTAQEIDAETIRTRFSELETHDRFYTILGVIGYERIEDIPSDKRLTILAQIEKEIA